MSAAPEQLRVAIVGCGNVAASHAHALRSHPDTTLVAGVDPRTEARRRFSKAWGCPSFESLAHLHAKAQVDAAIVCAPTGLHHDLCSNLLRHGVDVLCETPLATDSAGARALYGGAADLGRVLMTASTYRYLEDLEEVRRLLREEEIGRLLLYEVRLCSTRAAKGAWRCDPETAGGGVLIDLGVHALDILFAVINAPIGGLAASFSPRSVCMDVEDTAEVQFRTKAGTLGRIALSWSYDAWDDAFLVIQGTKGAIRVGTEGIRYRLHGHPRWRMAGSGFYEPGVRRLQLDAFLVQLREREPPVGIPLPVQALQLIDRAYDSERDGSWSWRLFQKPEIWIS